MPGSLDTVAFPGANLKPCCFGIIVRELSKRGEREWFVTRVDREAPPAKNLADSSGANNVCALPRFNHQSDTISQQVKRL